jgi:undecaprenyl phosphate N,N'-diacetylbacillosamine 1-phosphate transferase
MGKQNSFIKRLTDVFFSILILSIFSPVLILAAIAIKMESRGPIFFLHERTGLMGKKFRLYKLRGMVNNALKIGPGITQRNDPRLTRVGKLLRRTSIDEIPNFINVLKGEMSIVGPRPDISEITDKYSSDEKKVLEFKPGVTGFSQINGRQMLTPEARVKMEIAYYKKATFFSDLIILFKTIGVVFNNRGNI